MNSKLSVKIQPSKIYLILSVTVYLAGFFSAWYYFYTLWLSLIMSGVFSIWLLYFLPKNVWLTRADSIVKITLDENKLIFEKNDQSVHQYSIFYLTYQSQFLVIINAGKESLVIFKDALTTQSLSQINRYFNTKTNANA